MTAPVAGASSEGIAPSSNDSVTTAAVTTNVSGSTFIAAITWDRPTPSVANFESIVDSKGNTYTTIGTQASYGPTSDPQARIFICENGVGGSGHTVTVTLTDPPNDMSLTLFFLEVIGDSWTKKASLPTRLKWARMIVLPRQLCSKMSY